MSREDEFDSFYHATRRGLVLQAFALTGDLPAAHVAVREAYTAAWHHWRKVSAHDDPQDWVRPRAWRLAQRRHSARLWRRDKSHSADESAVLEAIGKLPMSQRKALLLTRLASLSPPHAARELGVSQEEVETLRSKATADLAANLDVDPSKVREHLLSLGEAAHRVRLPRASIIRRAGTKRRQSHTFVAATAATATVIASGAFAYQDQGARAPALPPATAAPAVVAEEPEPVLPSKGDLLDKHQITRLGLGQEWRVARTHDNTSGTGVNTACQKARFADPDGLSAFVRTFEAVGGRSERSAVQTVEISKSAGQAERAFGTTVGWYAGCQVARLQLLNAYRVDHIGDQAQVLMVRVWSKPVTTYSVAVARTGRVVTSTVGETVGAQPPPPSEIAQSLADAVSMLCPTSGSRNCAKQPTFAAVPPPPSGEEARILAVADLPPVGRVDEPWVGTDPRPARVNPSATVCDRADFAEAGAKKTRTRSFLIPSANLPDRFGLSETYAVFGSTKAAGRFLGGVRARVDSCEDRNPAADVSGPRALNDPRSRMDGSLWDVETEVSDNASVMFRIGFVRVGDTVAQVSFSPTAGDDISPGQFEALVVRAGDRLRELG